MMPLISHLGISISHVPVAILVPAHMREAQVSRK